jgi:DNA-binding CsgD family transcriptional regulator
MVASPLADRLDECEVLGRLLDTVRGGMSQALVIRGEAGIGKTTLLDYVTALAAEFHVERAVGIESEMELSFAALHQLVTPFMPGVHSIPRPQGDALRAAFGLATAKPNDRFLVGLATLSLLASAAVDQPILCLIDDAQWLDRESAEILAFVARRLHADRIALIFAVRDTEVQRSMLEDLPQLPLGGLPDAAARQLLTAVTGPVARHVFDRLVNETGGNPLALVELGGKLTSSQFADGTRRLGPLPLGRRLQELFLHQVRDLPVDTQRLLLLAAAERLGDRNLLWRAAAGLGIDQDAADPAVTEKLIILQPHVSFRHPLIRSAVYHGASPAERRAAHQALAEALDPEREPDRRAWHRAAAAVGPDEGVAGDLARSAARATSRGGYAAAATLLELAAELSSDPLARAERQLDAAGAELIAGNAGQAHDLLQQAQLRLREPLHRAQALRLEGAIQFALGEGDQAPGTLLRAAQAFEPVDLRASRDTMLEAMEAAFYARRAMALRVALAAADLPRASLSRPNAVDLLLDGFTALLTAGPMAAAPLLRRAIEVLGSADLPAEQGLRWLGLGCWAASELLDEGSWRALAKRLMQLCRDRGALTRLPTALDYLGEWEVITGHFAAAAALSAERQEILAATGNPELIGAGATALVLSAWRGWEADARSVAGSVTDASSSRGQGVGVVYAQWALAVLELGFGNYKAARVHALVTYYEDCPYVGTLALPDVVEAAVRSDDRESAMRALSRLEQRAGASGTELAQGLLARCQALLAEDGVAEALYREATERLERTNAELDLARTHLLHGEWLRRQRRRLDAREQLRTAYQMLLSIGAEGFAERARHELLATGEKTRKRTEATREELTPQEAQIAHLVSLGLTNPAIATQLFISASTVEHHLRMVYRKLGVSSRTQLAHRLHQQAESSPTP